MSATGCAPTIPSGNVASRWSISSRLDGDEIEYFERYDIGVAVDTPEGLPPRG